MVGTWVIVATDRARRPSDYRVEHPQAGAGPVCPFCPGNEERTPGEVYASRPHDGPAARGNAPGWSTRVFPNKFPALMVEGDLDRTGEGIYDRMNGVGAHEVVVETPEHGRQLHDLAESELVRVIEAWRARILDLKNDVRFRYVLVFKNHGAAAGVSLEHSHSQLIALPTVPKNVRDELEGADDHFRLKERCIYCDIVRQELAQRVRLVHDNPDFVAIAPWASRFPFETWILPRRHRTSFEDTPQAEMAALANAIRAVLRKMHRALDDPPYNFAVHTAPLRQADVSHYHWHVEIIPSLTRMAGFEMGTGFHINPTPPEEAARFLRELPSQ